MIRHDVLYIALYQAARDKDIHTEIPLSQSLPDIRPHKGLRGLYVEHRGYWRLVVYCTGDNYYLPTALVSETEDNERIILAPAQRSRAGPALPAFVR